MDTLPPPPPTKKEEEFIPGKFDYIENKSEKIMLTTAYKAINVTESWDFIKTNFDYGEDKIYEIYNKIIEFGYDGHSGSSFTITMNQMKFIANYGEIKFKEKYEKC